MREGYGNLFHFAGPGNVIVIPTNGEVNRYDRAIMGAGVALAAAARWPRLPKDLGRVLRERGNVLHGFVYRSPRGVERVVTFPTKDTWANPALLHLIEKNAQLLAKWAESWEDGRRIYLPRLGCGNGKLEWQQVQPVLAKYFDDRFTVVCLRKGKG